MAILPYSYKPVFGGTGGGGSSASSWMSGHPLHFGLTFVLFLSTSYLWFSSSTPATFTPTSELDIPLSQRLERSEAAYQRSIDGRAYLYKMYGNDPVSYPKDPPYPPYTVWDFVDISPSPATATSEMLMDPQHAVLSGLYLPIRSGTLGMPGRSSCPVRRATSSSKDRGAVDLTNNGDSQADHSSPLPLG